MTPWELSVYADAYADRQRQTAYLQGMVIRAMIGTAFSGKHAPSFHDLFGQVHNTNETMDDDALYRQILAINKALGGTVEGVS